MEYKTPTKQDENCVDKKDKTPEKTVNDNDFTTPKKKSLEADDFKTPEKSLGKNKSKGKLVEREIHSRDESKTPEKTSQSFNDKTQHKTESEFSQCDGEEGMISTTEQARLLIAARKTPLKATNKTPVKQSTPSGKRSAENSPMTPGKFRRVELITLSSPKAKRLKQM